MVPESAPPTCPTCQDLLAKRPRAKTKCRQCGAFIYVRTRAAGGRWLLSEGELAGVEAEWTQKREAAATAPPPPDPLWTAVHVVGESHQNDDGTSRQRLIRTRARDGLEVHLVPEPDNLYDDNAVKVCLPTGEQLGYLSSDDAAELAEQRQAGWRHAAIIHRVLGGTEDKPSRGVLLRLVSAPPGTTEAQIHAAIADARAAPDSWDQRAAVRSEGLPRVMITLEGSAHLGQSVAPAGGEETRRWPWAIIIGVSLGLAAVLYLLAR